MGRTTASRAKCVRVLKRFGEQVSADVTFFREFLDEAAQELGQDHPGITPRAHQRTVGDGPSDTAHGSIVTDFLKFSDNRFNGEGHIGPGIAVGHRINVQSIDDLFMGAQQLAKGANGARRSAGVSVLGEVIGSDATMVIRFNPTPHRVRKYKENVHHGISLRNLRQEAVIWHERLALAPSHQATLESQHPTCSCRHRWKHHARQCLHGLSSIRQDHQARPSKAQRLTLYKRCWKPRRSNAAPRHVRIDGS